MSNIIIEIFYNILYMSIIASMLAIIILVLRKIFDKKISPRWKFAMWILLFISLLIPFRVTVQSNNSYQFFLSSFIDIIENIKNTLIAQNRGRILIFVWLLGCIILSILYLIQSIHLRKCIGNQQVEDEKVIKIFEEAKEKMGIKRNIRLIKQEYKKVPCIYGILDPKILMTDTVLKKDSNTIKYIFMHELAHYKRRDIILNSIMLIIMIVHWFNPILWWCFKQIRQDMELKADDSVLKNINKTKRKEYAMSLVKLLEISQEEKNSSKLLCVTDNKNNMERRIKMIKLSEKFKEYKTLIGVTTLLLTLSIGMLIFTQIKINTGDNGPEIAHNNTVQYFENPDRIVYKVKNEDKYYVFKQKDEDFEELKKVLTTCIEGLGEGETLNADAIKKIEDEEEYIELDYNTISKNYIISYDKLGYNVIKRTDKGGQIVRNSIYNKEILKEKLNEKIKSKQYYQMLDNKQLTSTNTLTLKQEDLSSLHQYETGIYGIVIEDMSTWLSNHSKYNISIENEITYDTFEKANVILMISKYNVEDIETRIGGMTYKFNGNDDGVSQKYNVSIFVASKAINSNCIYRDVTQVTHNYAVSKPVTTDISKTAKITQEKAKEIATKALKADDISSWEDMKVYAESANKYYLERWTDTNKDYKNKYEAVNQVEYVDTWHVEVQDAGYPGCGVNIWIDISTGEVLCYHWTGE